MPIDNSDLTSRKLGGSAQAFVVGLPSPPPLRRYRGRPAFTLAPRFLVEPNRLLTSDRHFPARTKYVKEWGRYPALVWLNRFDTLVLFLLAGKLCIFGYFLEVYAPQLGTSGPQMLIWEFFISSTVLFHGTVTINSLDHMFGRRRHPTSDTSRNNAFLDLITLGEGWHNNHHH